MSVPDPGRRDLFGAGPRRVPGLRRRARCDPRGVAVSGRTARGAPDGAPLRDRNRALRALRTARAGPASAADLGRTRRGRCATGPRRRRPGGADAHRGGRAAGQAGQAAADHLRPAGNPGRSGAPAASGRPRRGAALRAAARAGAQQSRGRSRRDRLAGRCRPPLAVGLRHPANDALRHLPRPQLRRRYDRARTRLRRRIGARRVGGVSRLRRRRAPDLCGRFWVSTEVYWRRAPPNQWTAEQRSEHG